LHPACGDYRQIIRAFARSSNPKQIMKSTDESRTSRDTDTGEPTERLVDEVMADGATNAEAAPPDSYMTTDGSAATSTTNPRPLEQGQSPAMAEQKEKYLRLAAEFDNFRRRSIRERQEAAPRAQAELVKQMLDALDDLARFAHVDPASTNASTIVEGVNMVEKKMLKALNAAGLEIVNPASERFDPAKHEAVSIEPTTTAEEDGQVARVFQQGYLFNGQLLRPARVVVKQHNG
jgi:molecular chaperone GrpE